MRIAALADIHGNLPALEAVLGEVEREEVDAVVVVGDTVSGPFSVEAFDRVANLPNARFVRGNVERMVLEGVDEHGRDWSAERIRLGDARLATVATWPVSVELDVDGLGSLLACHSTPGSEDPIYTRITPDDELLDLLGPVHADVLVSGHTHVQYDRRLSSGLRVVNPGSVGMPYEGRRGAFWALLGPDVQLRHTAYDVEAAAASIRRSGFPDAEEHAESLLEPPDPAEATAWFESRRGA